jgi:hypothetical protein
MSENVPLFEHINALVTKRATKTLKSLFYSKLEWVLKNADFYADSRFVEVGPKMLMKKVKNQKLCEF